MHTYHGGGGNKGPLASVVVAMAESAARAGCGGGGGNEQGLVGRGDGDGGGGGFDLGGSDTPGGGSAAGPGGGREAGGEGAAGAADSGAPCSLRVHICSGGQGCLAGVAAAAGSAATVVAAEAVVPAARAAAACRLRWRGCCQPPVAVWRRALAGSAVTACSVRPPFSMVRLRFNLGECTAVSHRCCVRVVRVSYSGC